MIVKLALRSLAATADPQRRPGRGVRARGRRDGGAARRRRRHPRSGARARRWQAAATSRSARRPGRVGNAPFVLYALRPGGPFAGVRALAALAARPLYLRARRARGRAIAVRGGIPSAERRARRSRDVAASPRGPTQTPTARGSRAIPPSVLRVDRSLSRDSRRAGPRGLVGRMAVLQRHRRRRPLLPDLHDGTRDGRGPARDRRPPSARARTARLTGYSARSDVDAHEPGRERTRPDDRRQQRAARRAATIASRSTCRPRPAGGASRARIVRARQPGPAPFRRSCSKARAGGCRATRCR